MALVSLVSLHKLSSKTDLGRARTRMLDQGNTRLHSRYVPDAGSPRTRPRQRGPRDVWIGSSSLRNLQFAPVALCGRFGLFQGGKANVKCPSILYGAPNI